MTSNLVCLGPPSPTDYIAFASLCPFHFGGAGNLVDQARARSTPVHKVMLDAYLESHDNLKAMEFYLCLPPMMIKPYVRTLTQLGANLSQVANDIF